MLTAAVKALTNATEDAMTQIALDDVQMQPMLLRNTSVVRIMMMDPDIGKYRRNGELSNFNITGGITDCIVKEEYHRFF